MSHFTAQEKLRILKRVLRKNERVKRVCLEEGISRKTFYEWKKRYLLSGKRGSTRKLKRNVKLDKRKVVGEAEFRRVLLNLVVSHPKWSARKYAEILREQDLAVSHMTVSRQLHKLELDTAWSREEFSDLHTKLRRVKGRYERRHRWLMPEMRKRMIEEVVVGGRSVRQVCRDYHVSRKTFYKWKKRYEEFLLEREDVSRVEAFWDRHLRGNDHPLAVAPLVREQIIDLVAKEPVLSCHTIAQRIGGISHRGVQNVLLREGLNTIDKRVAWVQERATVTPAVRPELSWLDRLKLVVQEFLPSRAPAPPPLGLPRGKPLLRGKPLFRGKPSFLLRRYTPYLLFSLLIFFSLYQWGYLLGQASSTQQAMGWMFASIALTMGSFFFLYSLKYYFTLAIVLSFSREAGSDQVQSSTQEGGQAKLKVKSSTEGWLARLFGINIQEVSKEGKVPKVSKVESFGLDPKIAETELERYPFISVHLPMYNEKRVAERLLRACTSFEYANKVGQVQYEVVVADDSTDETTQIISNYLSKLKVKSEKLKVNEEEGKTITEAEVNPGIKIKHIQRTTREGFKGGALREALRFSDPRAEFIVVFDADFVPYPDTLELFVKYFQASAGGLGAKDLRLNTQAKGYRDSNIAAVQGYQPAYAQELRRGEWPRKDSSTSLATPSDSGTQRGKHVLDYRDSKIAAVQGYQWHVLNKSENWITRGVRSEYAGSYVVERSGEELYQGLKQIAGSVYMIRRDLLERFNWGTSITEDFQLTLKLYEAGYKVVYTPYIQAPAECASTLKRLIRQRMRWAEGHSHNIRTMFWRLIAGRWADVTNSKLKVIHSTSSGQESSKLQSEIQNSTPMGGQAKLQNNIQNDQTKKTWIPSPLSLSEKLEFLYLSPYYLQAAFFLIGTISWLFAETIFAARLPFWTSVWGWSLVLTNMLSLPLMNSIGLFLEEAEEKDFLGTLSFIALSYILIPFQAYASVKGFIESEEGPWFRTPKTGKVTDIIKRGRLYRFITEMFGRPAVGGVMKQSGILPAISLLPTIFNPARSYSRRRMRMMVRGVIAIMLIISLNISYLAMTISLSSQPVYGNTIGIGGENEATESGVMVSEATDLAIEHEQEETIVEDNQSLSSSEAVEKQLEDPTSPSATVGQDPTSPAATLEAGESFDIAQDSQPQIFLTDNRIEGETVSSRDESEALLNKEPASELQLEEHNPSTHPYEYYVQDDVGRFVPYFVSESDVGVAVEVRSERGVQKYVFNRDSDKIGLYEKEYGGEFELKAETRPVYEYKDSNGKWKEYIPLIQNEINVERYETYTVITSKTRLLEADSNIILGSSVELKIGYINNKFTSKFSFNLEDNQNVNRLRWETTIVQSEKCKVPFDFAQDKKSLEEECGGVEEDVGDLREEVDPELEEYFSASLLGVPVTEQQYGNIEMEWEDFVQVESEKLKVPEKLRHGASKSYEERLYSSLYPDLSMLPENYPIRVEQNGEENANIVYFYPNGKQGKLEIDPTLALTTGGSTVQVDVANRYQAIMITDDTTDYLIIKDRAESDGSPDITHEFKGPCVLETNTFCLRDDDNRITTILENTNTRIKVRVEGKLNNEASTDYLDDDGADDDVDVRVDYTFTTEGVFIENETDFKDGLGLDAETATGHEGYEWLAVYADVTDGAFNEGATPDIIRGDGETETNSTNHANDAEFAETEKYVIMPGTGSDTYQDAFVGIQRAGWYAADAGTTPTNEWHWFEDEVSEQLDLIAAQEQNYLTSGKHYTKWFFLMLAEDDLDTEAEREAYINDYQNSDYLTYTTGSEWNDNIHGSPGLNYDGTDDYVDAGDHPAFNSVSEFSVSAWLRDDDMADTGCCRRAVHKDIDINNDVSLFATYLGRLYVEVGNGSNAYAYWDPYNSEIANGEWYHATTVYDGSQANADRVKLFINGVQKTLTGIPTWPTQTADLSSQTLYIGWDGAFWDGRIDDVRIYDSPLTQAQIRSVMVGDTSVASANLQSHWTFNENTGDTAHDETSNNYDGDLAGSGGSCPGASACPVWTTGYVPDHYNEAEGYHTITAANPTTTEAASQVQIDLDGGGNVSTLANGAVTAETGTVTVDSTGSFAATGVAYIEGDKFSYTGTNGTQFTGVATSGELAVIGHADNAVVSQPPRHNPSLKVRNWRDPRTPQTVNVEGTTKFEGTDYNSDIKPFTTSYFAQDLVWHSPLESTTSDVGDNITLSGCSFVAGRYGNGLECNATDEDANFTMTSNIDVYKGAIEFWFQPEYAHTDSTYYVLFQASGATDVLRLVKDASNVLDFRIYDGSTNFDLTVTSGNYSWNAYDWVHFRLEWDESAAVATQQRLFINGTEPTHTDDPESDNYDGSLMSLTTMYLGNHTDGASDCGCILDEFRIYDFNGSGDQAALDKLSGGGDTADADEYLADTANDYTFDFNADDASNRGEFLWMGSDSRFTGVNYELTTQGVGSSAVFTWEYWDGAGWSSLTVTEGVSGSDTFETTSGTFYFTDPGDWFPYSVNGSTDLYYIRGHLESGSYTTDPIESNIKTDILLFQYLSDITSEDQTFILSAAPVRQSSGSIQVDVPNRYRMIMNTGDTDDYMTFYDRAEDDGAPDATHEFKGPCVLETNTFCLRDDSNRITTILESNDVRVRIRVEGKMNNEASTDYLDDDGADDDVNVKVDYTFTTEGVFVENETDFKDGLELDAETATGHEGYEWLAVYADVTDGAFNEGATPDIIRGDGETETNSTNHANDAEFEETETYVVMPGTGSDTYQDAFIGIQRAGWYGADAGTTPTNEWHWFEDEVSSQLDLIAAQEQNYTTANKHYTKWFFLMLAEDDLDRLQIMRRHY